MANFLSGPLRGRRGVGAGVPDPPRPSAFVSDTATPYDRKERNASPCSGRGPASRGKLCPGWALRCETARRPSRTEGTYT